MELETSNPEFQSGKCALRKAHYHIFGSRATALQAILCHEVLVRKAAISEMPQTVADVRGLGAQAPEKSECL